MHKGALLLKLLMGPLGGECSTQFVSLATLPSFSFISPHTQTHTYTLPLHLPLKSQPYWPSLMLLIRLSITLEEIDDYLILITYKGETLFDVFCVLALWLPIAFTLPHTHPSPLPTSTLFPLSPEILLYEAGYTHSGEAASVLQGELFPGTCYY